MQLGWRPTVIVALGADSSASMNYFVDGLTGDDDTALVPTGGGAIDHDATPGISVDDSGFTIGQETTFFDRNNAQRSASSFGGFHPRARRSRR